MLHKFPVAAPSSPVRDHQPAASGATRRANLLTADASRVSSSRFLARALSAFMPAPSETSEKADAARRFINASWGKSRDEIAELRAQFQREKAEIGERYRAARDAASEVAL